ncbi:MAG: hypothetical protein LBJ47_10585, partial [Tannerella sp.]|nr:hypothetical protein [Tannerella sp.]
QGALKKEFVVGIDGEPLEDYYTLPAGQSTFKLYFYMKDVPEEVAGQTGYVEATLLTGGSDKSAEVTLYNRPAYDGDLPLIRPYVDVNSMLDLGITGGSPNLMRSINGHTWRNAYEPLNETERMSVGSGGSLWLREPNGCWEEQFFFISYEEPEIRRYIDIVGSEGIITNPGSGRHYAPGYSNFTFTASFPGGIPLKVMAKGFYSGRYEELTGRALDDGAYEYVIYRVVEPWTVTFGPEPASVITGEERVGGLSVWSYKNTLNIRSDVKTKAYIYTLSGSLLKCLDVQEGDNREILERGIYVIVIGNNRCKVIIN